MPSRSHPLPCVAFIGNGILSREIRDSSPGWVTCFVQVALLEQCTRFAKERLGKSRARSLCDRDAVRKTTQRGEHVLRLGSVHCIAHELASVDRIAPGVRDDYTGD